MNGNPLKAWFIYPLILILLISPALVYYSIEGYFNHVLLAIIIQGAIFSLPVILFYRRLHLYFYILLPVVILAPFALIPPVLFSVELNTDILNLVVNTTTSEATELFGSMVFVIILIFIAYVILYVFLVKKSLRKIPFRSAAMISGIGLFIIILTASLKSGFVNIIANTKSVLVSYYPTSTSYMAVKYSSKIKKIDHEALIKDFSFNAYKKDSLHQRQIFVLVIGETSRYHNWGINDYERNTTPKLSERKDILNFKNAVTAATMTEQSVPIIITRATADDFDRHYSEKGIEAVFSESGFKTYWITNQTDYQNIKMHMDEVKNTVSSSKSFSTKKSIYDIFVVDELKKVLDENTDSSLFIIIHTMGSHFNYSLRYPSEFDVFLPSGKGKSLNPLRKSNKEKMINSYDNSILYTDYILDSIINLINEQKVVSSMIYASDHGEDLFDDERENSLHAFAVPSRYVTHIPFLIWTSEKYDSLYFNKYEVLRENIQRPVSSDNIFETLVDMANIGYPEADTLNSIASPAFKDSEQKLLSGDLKLHYYKDLW